MTFADFFTCSIKPYSIVTLSNYDIILLSCNGNSVNLNYCLFFTFGIEEMIKIWLPSNNKELIAYDVLLYVLFCDLTLEIILCLAFELLIHIIDFSCKHIENF